MAKNKKIYMELYPEIDISNPSTFKKLSYFHEIFSKNATSRSQAVDLTNSAMEYAEYDDVESISDAYKIALSVSSIYKMNTLKKIAYPNGYGALNEKYYPEYNLEKWASLVNDIYEIVASRNVEVDDAIKIVSASLDEDSGERDNFEKWIKYYKSGEHKKYASLKKDAFQFSPSNLDFYGVANIPDLTDKNKIQEIKEQMNSSKEDPAKNLQEWKSKLYKAIRGIDKILRDGERVNVNDETLSTLFNVLHDFNTKSRQIKMASTAADFATNYASKFKKLGSSESSDILLKFAQAVSSEQDVLSEQPAAPTQAQEVAPQPQEDGQKADPGAAVVSQNDKLKSVFEGKAANPDEYKDIEGEATLQKAADKLEEVAASLSDRRIIRQLAEFDIILDKLGIASMFPELAEAQSRLIDSYSYALTRVTKMLGMLSSGKDMVELSNAKTTELRNKTVKEVNKTLESQPIPFSGEGQQDEQKILAPEQVS